MEIFLILIIALGVIAFLFWNIGNWLTREDEPEKSDIIFILMGSIRDRALLTVDLYNGGYATKILFTTPEVRQTFPLSRNSGEIPSNAEIMKTILTQKYIDGNSIQVLNGTSFSTLDEAKILATYCEENPSVKKILVVTSIYHSGRAFKILNRELRRKELDVKLIFPLNSFTNYDKRNWWLTGMSSRFTIQEVLKTIWYFGWKSWVR